MATIESNVNFLGMTLRRHGIREFPPARDGREFPGNPLVEGWNIEAGLMPHIDVRTATDDITSQDVVRGAIRGFFHLPDTIGVEDFEITSATETVPPQLVIDYDHELSDIMKAYARAGGAVTHLAVLDTCLRGHLQGPGPRMPTPQPPAQMRMARPTPARLRVAA